MESLAQDEGLEKFLEEEAIKDPITTCSLEKETKEARLARMTFPRIFQLLHLNT